MLLFKRGMSLLLATLLLTGMLPTAHIMAEELEPTVEIALETEETAEETLAAAAVPETTAPAETAAQTQTTEPAQEETEEPAVQTYPEEILTEETVAEKICWAEAALPDSDALYEEYLNRLFFGNSGIVTMGTLARDMLSNADKYLYDELKKVITQIADGKKKSTLMEISFVETDFNGGEVNLDRVMDALMHDCAYELYWLDGWMWSNYGYKMRIWLLPVENYQTRDFDQYNPTIDTDKTGRAAAAAENSRSIVAEYASCSDYDKLAAYADKICSLVEYDYDAAYSDLWRTNINPWTLVNVFDNDPDTNVVCEGYAEAFQYLCDQSEFVGEIKCYSVTGADHKWNIVRINGVSYLMDVTHCDYGTKADRGEKFLGGGKGSVERGYVIGGFHYWYFEEVKALWGTGEDSILKLSDTKYSTTISQKKFVEELESSGGIYELHRDLELTSDLTISDVMLLVEPGVKIRVAKGAELTITEDVSLYMQEGAELTVDAGASLICFATIFDDFGGIRGDGKILLARFEAGADMLQLSGHGVVSAGDLDTLSGKTRWLLIEPGITAIGDKAFSKFTGLESISFSDGLTAIGKQAFSGCGNLEMITFPASLQKLGDNAFADCTGLMTIVFLGSAPKFEGYGKCFSGVTASVFYPRSNETWTEAVRQNYGGTLTWYAQCGNEHEEAVLPGTAPNCIMGGLSDGVYCTFCGMVLVAQEELAPTGIHTYSNEFDTICDICNYDLVLGEAFPFSDFEWQVLKLTNKERADAGLAPLTGFAALQRAGDIRAEELHVAFDHIRPNGTTCFTVLDEVGLSYRYAGENIASGYRSPAEVVDGWMNSQGHRENILNGNFSHMAVGENKYNWVQLFISGSGYSSIRLESGDSLTLEPGTSLDEVNLVGVLDTQSGAQCYLPVTAAYCQGYDPNTVGEQSVTISVLGVSTTVAVHIHDWVKATCTEPKTCLLCGETEGEALGHKYKEAKTKPTCTESGYITSTCAVCGDVQIQETEPALGHKEVTDKATDPTCTEPGKTQGKHCSVCDAVLIAQEELPALGHDEIVAAGYAPTCIRTGLSDGSHCGRCSAVLAVQEIIASTGHDFADGYCLRCGGEDKADYTLYSGKNLTLKQYDPDTGKAYTAKQLTWTLAEEFAPFATVSKTGKLTAKKVFEKVRVEAVATLTATGEAVTYLVDIYPAVTQVEATIDGEMAANNATVLMDFADEPKTIKINAYPEDTLANATWTISDKKNQYAEYTIEGDTLTITNPKSKAGTVTIKATAEAGVKKTVTMKVQFGSFANVVEIAKPEKTTLRAGETLVLSAAITEPETVTKPGIVWSVSDKTAATVSSGKVKAKNVAHPTTVTVTATSKDGQAKTSIDLTILPRNEGQLVLMQNGAYITNSTKALNVGDTYQLNAAVIRGGEPVAETVTWTSSKDTVATVDENGMITAVGNGTAKITAEVDGKKASVTVKVATLVSAMEITTKDGKNLIDENGEKVIQVSSGKGVNLVANILTEGAAKTVTWEITEGAQYAKISTSGKLTANKDLTKPVYVTVKATAKDGSGASATIRVKILPLATGVQIYQNGTRVRSNTTFVCDMITNPTLKLSAKVYPSTANQTVELTSSNKKVAEFVDGELICHKPGTVTITAKALDGSNQKSTFKLTIVKKVTSLTLKEGANLTVTGGKSLKLAPMVQINPTDATNKKLTWSVAPNEYGIKISTSGTLSTKKVTEPVVINVMVTTQDGSGCMLSINVTVNPA